MKKARLFFLLILLTVAIAVWWYEHGTLTLHGGLEHFVQEQRLSHGEIAIIHHNKIISHFQVGDCDEKYFNAQYPIASLSKLLTAQVVVKLIGEGKLQLNDKLFTLLPQLPYANDAGYREITVQHLLQHTAGFDRSKSGDPLFKDDSSVRGCESAVRVAVSKPLEHEPNKITKYSNVGYCLLGMLIERVTELNYENALLQRLLPQENINRLVLGGPPTSDIKSGFQISQSDWYSLGAAGGWFSDAVTLAKILRYTPPRDLVLQPLPSELEHMYYYGQAWRTWLKPNHRLTHYGALSGFYSFAMKLADEYVVVALFEGRPSNDEDAAAQLINIFESHLR